MANITLKQLRYFEALAKHGHFGHAAATCAVSQPALSVQIKELEAQLGAALFERSPRNVSLTRAGEALLAKVRDILGDVDALGDVVRVATGAALGRLRIGIIPTIAPYLLPQLIGTLADHQPGMDLHVRETMTPKLLQELGDGRIDTAILALPVSEGGLTEVALFDEEFVLVRPQSDKGQPVPNGEALRQMRLLLLEEGHCFRDQALSFCATPAALPRDGLDGSSLTTLVQMVSAGIGVTLIPQMAVSVEAGAASVVVDRFPAPRPQRTIGMVWRKSSPLHDQFTVLAGVIRSALTQPRAKQP